MKKIGILVIVGLLLVGGVFAYGGFNQQKEERFAKMNEVFEFGDYDSWISEMNQRHEERMAEMTPERFEQMNEVHEAMAEGDFAKAQELRNEIGFEEGFGKGRMKGGFRDGSAGHAGCPFVE